MKLHLDTVRFKMKLISSNRKHLFLADASQQFLVATMEKMERLIAINNVQCVQFRPRVANDQYYIILINGNGCSSYVNQFAYFK